MAEKERVRGREGKLDREVETGIVGEVCHKLTKWPCVNHLTTLSFVFPIYKSIIARSYIASFHICKVLYMFSH